MATNDYKCGVCGRTFSMAAHLARHTSTMHAAGGKKKTTKKKTKKGKVGRPKGKKSTKKKKGGWPKGKKRTKKGGWPKDKKRAGKRGGPRGRRSVAGINLSQLSIDQLGDLIDTARAQARRKIDELKRAIG